MEALLRQEIGKCLEKHKDAVETAVSDFMKVESHVY